MPMVHINLCRQAHMHSAQISMQAGTYAHKGNKMHTLIVSLFQIASFRKMQFDTLLAMLQIRPVRRDHRLNTM